MNRFTIGIAATIVTIVCASPCLAENLSHTRQLLSTKECANCNLANAGLVMSELAGANLSSANLVGANLSRANLVGANLRGANLTGTSLYGANLTGADLTGAILEGTDLRETYLTNARMEGVNISRAHLQGAMGIPERVGSAEDFYRWGFSEWQQNNLHSAVYQFDRAIALDPQYASAYLGRSLSRYRLGNDVGAMEDAKLAERIFVSRQNTEGIALSQRVQGTILAAQRRSRPSDGGGGSIGDTIMGIGSLLFNVFR
jgi:tetratricopeptide (TPR) repeat protein